MEYQYGKDGKVVRERKQGRIRKEGVEGKRTTLLSLHKVHSKGGTGKHFILGNEFVFCNTMALRSISYFSVSGFIYLQIR